MILALVIGGLLGTALGVLIGRSGLRAEQRRSVVVLQPWRVWDPWDPSGTRKS